MTFTYKPVGVCSREIVLELAGDIVESVSFTDGCAGNSGGIERLVAGMKVSDVIERLKGVRCGKKATSCPDQLALALTQALEAAKVQQAAV